ncbi:SelT/selW/selH domain protein [Streptomyces sp. NBC_00704]|nr:SelT/selW/selH domain protein [Streptomyces sp. NBC_00704]
MPRAPRPARERLTTFASGLTGRRPGGSGRSPRPGTGGVSVVRVDDEVVRDRREQGFPEPTGRGAGAPCDRAAPDRSPGRSPGRPDTPGL